MRPSPGCGFLAILGTLMLNLTVRTASGFELLAVPKNKSAKMSSQFCVGCDPILGNDGNRLGPESGATVFHTDNGDRQPWWMVDMEQLYAVFGVRVWNRIDGMWAQRFTQIMIGVTNNSSVWTAFNLDLFDLCYFYTDIPTAADNPINMTCNTPIVGRYLTVHKDVTAFPSVEEFLHFVEIDIFTMSKGSSCIVSKTKPSFSASSSSLLSEWTGLKKSRIECVVQCLLHPQCLFALVRSDSRSCWLFGSARIPDSFSDGFISGVSRLLAVYG